LRSCRARDRVPFVAAAVRAAARSFQRHETISEVVLLVRLMAFAEGFMPLAASPAVEKRIAALDSGMHQSELNARCEGHALTIDLRTADHHERVPARRDPCGIERCDDDAAFRRKARCAAQ